MTWDEFSVDDVITPVSPVIPSAFYLFSLLTEFLVEKISKFSKMKTNQGSEITIERHETTLVVVSANQTLEAIK